MCQPPEAWQNAEDTHDRGRDKRQERSRETKQNTNEKVVLAPGGYSVPLLGGFEAKSELPGLYEISDSLI